MNQHDDEAARLLRETLHERADMLGGAPLAVPAARGRRRPVASLIAVGAAAVVAVLAVSGVAAWRAARPTAPPVPAASPSPSPSARGPAGWKPVASLGMEIYVPASWDVRGTVNESCDVLGFDDRVVSRPFGVVTAIGCDGLRQGTLVTFVADLPDGKAGREDLGDNLTQLTWLSPNGGAVVASGPDVAVLQQVVDTARAVDVDSLGCPTKPARPAWDRRRDGLPPVRLSGDVTDVVACFYTDVGLDDYRMLASARFDAAQRSALARSLSRAPAGAAPDVPGTCPDDAFGIIRVRTSAGPTELTFHGEGCIDRYVAGPDSQSAVTEALLATVMKALNLSYAFNGLPAG